MIFKCLDESQVFFFFYLCAKQSWLLLAMQSVPFSSRGINQRYCVMMMIAETVRQWTKWYIKLVLKETMKCMCCYLANQIVCILTIKCMCCCQSHKRCNSLAILWWSWPILWAEGGCYNYLRVYLRGDRISQVHPEVTIKYGVGPVSFHGPALAVCLDWGGTPCDLYSGV